ncbi:ferredoxin--NADP reductase [Sciscionella sediminilitoris]|uniref:ferredoxin--NADP reductase n=1 Tax=Sciscionella sediminilitoris TaxID=1445613 RepID=UPI0004DF5A46|nr:ferredoxin--NADP reductase [Sciscionella sp. SE31]
MTRSFLLTVAEVIPETAEASTIVFEVPEEHRAVFAHRAGQFTTVHIRLADGESVARSYSFSNPEGAQRPQVTVKRMGPGSEWMCALRPGSQVEVLAPGGTFTPATLDEDIVLAAAGSGITPVHSILRTVLEQGSGRVFLLYANPDAERTIFGEALTELAERHDRLELVHWHESERGLPTTEALTGLLGEYRGRRLYYCGPEGFKRVMSETVTALSWPADTVHVEEYLSHQDNPFLRPEPGGGAAAKVFVNLDDTDSEIEWPEGTKLLDTLLDNGLDAPYSCREGRCSTCACRLVGGEVKMLNNEILEQEDLDEGIILACQSLPLTEEVHIRYD